MLELLLDAGCDQVGSTDVASSQVLEDAVDMGRNPATFGAMPPVKQAYKVLANTLRGTGYIIVYDTVVALRIFEISGAQATGLCTVHRERVTLVLSSAC